MKCAVATIAQEEWHDRPEPSQSMETQIGGMAWMLASTSGAGTADSSATLPGTIWETRKAWGGITRKKLYGVPSESGKGIRR